MTRLHSNFAGALLCAAIAGSSFAVGAELRLVCRAAGVADPMAVAGEGWIARERAELETCARRNSTFQVRPVSGNPIAIFLGLRDQVETCYRSLGIAPPSAKLKLDYGAVGPNSALRSENYSVARLQKLIAMSLAANVDPTLAIALAMLENPPLIQNSAVQGYEYGFGDLPLDAFPLFDALKCLYRDVGVSRVSSSEWRRAEGLHARSEQLRERLNAIRGFESIRSALRARRDYLSNEGLVARLLREKCPQTDPELSRLVCSNPDFMRGLELERDANGADGEYEFFLSALADPFKEAEVRSRFEKRRTAFVVAPARLREVRLPWGGDAPSTYACATPGPLDPGVPAWFNLQKENDASACCAKVAGLTTDAGGAAKEIRNALAFEMITARIRIRPGALESLAQDVQAFNGRGRLGVTESLDNRCLSGLNMATHPFYGARVMDLIVSTLLPNEQIQGLIASAAVEFSRPIPSVLCAKLGVGAHDIPSATFLNLQRRYLLGGERWRRAACAARFR